ncbi:hypothetical protein ACFFSW_29490 [Saccharothrix longispora]|uniref:Uncharacterized protein n=1 Tax=Saccharothrix longispora TaxID=33920 RepID=A0ABU1PWI6_9PSEU|nr:hypothetical protein [Saccharothrix longispora]MDR6594994.1 hypothetical protein [Saccharothrix longispora]
MRSAVVVLAAVAALLGALPGPAWVVRRPEPPAPARAAGITITYRVDAVSRIARLGSDLVIGPGTLVAEIDLVEGTIVGDLWLPPAYGYFIVFGFVPNTARTDLVPVGKVTGHIREGEITAHSDLTIRLGEVAVDSQPLDVGQACETTAPAGVDLAGPFDLHVIRMKAVYTIPPFGGCRGREDLDPLMTGLVSGPDNLLDLTLTAQL